MFKVAEESKKIPSVCHVTARAAVHSRFFKAATANCLLSNRAERRSDLCSCLLNVYSSAYTQLYLKSGIWALHVSAGVGRMFDFILTFHILTAAIGNVQSESDKRSHTFIPPMTGGVEQKESSAFPPFKKKMQPGNIPLCLCAKLAQANWTVWRLNRDPVTRQH